MTFLLLLSLSFTLLFILEQDINVMIMMHPMCQVKLYYLILVLVFSFILGLGTQLFVKVP